MLTQKHVEAEKRRVKALCYAEEGMFAPFCDLIGYTPHAAQVEVHANRHIPRRVLD